MELSVTSKGKPFLSYEGFNYVIHRQSTDTVQWRCCRHNVCKAKLKTNGEKSFILNEQTVHSHEMENLGLVKGKEELRSLVNENPYAKPEKITLMALNNANATALSSSSKIMKGENINLLSRL